ncbi:MAG: nitrite reductase small subunit NirD [Deltaproteobacteria bacterium]|nr:MAG: nitrite reductase small subunit NirD [Deltaproteobacteria bacterium]
MQRLVVVGNGMVGHRFCERLVDLGCPARFEIAVFAEEPRPAYDRVHLSEFFAGRGAEELSLTSRDWYAEQGLDLQLGRAALAIDRERREVVATGGERFRYDVLVLASGSTPFVPAIPGIDRPGVFLYRTIDDLGAIRAWARGARRAAVIGGGLLGLEAAKAALDLGLEAHVIEFADRLMPRQLDRTGAALLRDAIEALGVRVHLGMATEAVVGDEQVRALRFSDQPELPVDLVIVSAGIRPRDDLARAAGLETAQPGGIAVDDALRTSDPRIFAIGECAVHRGVHYGLVAPGYEMADVLARRLAGEEVRFAGADLSAKLKLLGVDVASFGDYFADLERPEQARSLVFEDRTEGVYQKLLFDAKLERLLGGILVGDASAYLPLLSHAKTGAPVPAHPRELLFGKSGEPASASATSLPDAAQICSCNDVRKGDLVRAIADRGLETLAEVKKCTKAATGCGGCQPAVVSILEAELAKRGHEVVRHLCEHFSYTRQDLFWIVKLGRIETFDALLDSHGRGDGCEVCRPAVASILAATWNDLILEHAAIQDTNDRFLANIQRGGTYSVIPRIPGGEITPDKLIAIGEVAKKFDLYCKITGGQRIDLLGARVDQLPAIWEDLVAAGFESGHAYGKAMRTVKSCIGSTWCRYGVQDSTALAIRIEERYRGLRAPHKLKSAVSGCIRECAEAQSKDFGVIATEKGWNVYLCGNGGSHPRHADLFATDLSEDEVIRVLDRFLMFYIQTAKPLQRTARWLEEFDGGIAKLAEIILEDALGICDQLEADMQRLVDTYRCEWKAVVESPELRARFRHFAGGAEADDAIAFVRERGQKRPADWAEPDPTAVPGDVPAEATWTWQKLARVAQFPANGGAAVRYGKVQLAIYNFARRGEWYATQAMCPHRKDNVLARGLLGDQAGEPKVACPLHKKTFSLETGKGLSDPNYQVRTFPVELRGEDVWVKLPPAESLARELTCARRA